MSFEECVEELQRRAGSTVAIAIHPAESPRNVFEAIDGIDRVWSGENGTVYVVLRQAEAAVSLRPADFVEAECTTAETPARSETGLYACGNARHQLYLPRSFRNVTTCDETE